jgi:hypothetical protein
VQRALPLTKRPVTFVLRQAVMSDQGVNNNWLKNNLVGKK